MQILKNYRPHLFVLALFLSLWGGCYFFMEDGADCIRTIPDGAVRCECDFKSSDDYQKFKEDTHGTWEAVVLPNDPCKK